MSSRFFVWQGTVEGSVSREIPINASDSVNKGIRKNGSDLNISTR